MVCSKWWPSGKYRKGRRLAVGFVVVVRPPWTTARSHGAGQVPVEVGHVRPDLQPGPAGPPAPAVHFRQAVQPGQDTRVDPRPGDDDHPQVRHLLLGLRERRDHPPQQGGARPAAWPAR